jgi:hypothetical protein
VADPRAAAAAILAESARQHARRTQAETQDTEPAKVPGIRAEAIAVARAVDEVRRTGTGGGSISGRYRNAIANAFGNAFWEPGADPEKILEALRSTPIPEPAEGVDRLS